MEKTGMKPAPFLRVYSMIKFPVATPWVGSSKAFGMQVAQREGADCILPLVLVPTTQTKNLNQFTLFHFTTEVFHSVCSETSHYVSFISFLWKINRGRDSTESQGSKSVDSQEQQKHILIPILKPFQSIYKHTCACTCTHVCTHTHLHIHNHRGLVGLSSVETWEIWGWVGPMVDMTSALITQT